MVPYVDGNTEGVAHNAGPETGGRNPDLLRSPEAARYIDMSDSWLRQTRMADRTDGPPFLRQGRAVRYRRNDLDRWLERRLCGGDMQHPAPAPAAPAKRQRSRKPPPRVKGGRSRAAR
jgi:predicted DNA-binding transcriptional regulator AlpA